MELLGLLILILGGGATLIALLAAINIMLPVPLGRARRALENSLVRPFLLGLVNFLFCASIVALLGSGAGRFQGSVLGPILFFLALLILLALAVFAVFGLAAVAGMLGERMGEAKNPLSADLRGGLLLTLAGLAPFFGWYLFTPFALLTGLGAAIMAAFQRRTGPTLAEA